MHVYAFTKFKYLFKLISSSISPIYMFVRFYYVFIFETNIVEEIGGRVRIDLELVGRELV